MQFGLRVVHDDDRALYEIQRGRLPWQEFSKKFGKFVSAVLTKLAKKWRANDADREDAHQEVVLNLVDPARPRYDPQRASALSYLYLVVQSALHRVFDRQRRRERKALRELDAKAKRSDDTSAPSGMLARDDHDLLEGADFVAFVLAELDADDRELFVETASNDVTIQDLARARGVERTTLSRRLQRVNGDVQTNARLALAV